MLIEVFAVDGAMDGGAELGAEFGCWRRERVKNDSNNLAPVFSRYSVIWEGVDCRRFGGVGTRRRDSEASVAGVVDVCSLMREDDDDGDVAVCSLRRDKVGRSPGNETIGFSSGAFGLVEGSLRRDEEA